MATTTKLKLTENDKTNPLEFVNAAMEQIVEQIKKDALPRDQIGLTIQNDDPQTRLVYLSFRNADQINAQTILNEFL